MTMYLSNRDVRAARYDTAEFIDVPIVADETDAGPDEERQFAVSKPRSSRRSGMSHSSATPT